MFIWLDFSDGQYLVRDRRVSLEGVVPRARVNYHHVSDSVIAAWDTFRAQGAVFDALFTALDNAKHETVQALEGVRAECADLHCNADDCRAIIDAAIVRHSK